MDIYFIPKVIIQCYFIYFVAQIFPALFTKSSVSWLYALLAYTYQVLFCFVSEYFLTFSCYKMLQTHLIYILPQFYNETLFLRSPCSFYWRMILKTKIWTLAMFIGNKVWLLLDFSQLTEKETDTYYHIHVRINICMCICIYIKLGLWLHWFLLLVCRYQLWSSIFTCSPDVSIVVCSATLIL